MQSINADQTDRRAILSKLQQATDIACLAPSGDNVQPWLFDLDADHLRLRILVNEARDQTPMNIGQRMSRIAVGAAAYNVVHAAMTSNWGVHTSCTNNSIDLQFDQSMLENPLVVDPVIAKRHTNRWPFSGSTLNSLSENRLASFGSGPLRCSVSVRCDLDRTSIDHWANLIAFADKVLFSIPEMRNAFLANIRFDLPCSKPAPSGLGLGTLGAGFGDRLALRALRSIPDWMFNAVNMSSAFESKSRKLASSASGICIGFRDGDSPETDFAVGHMMNKVWLELCALDIQVQPMMSLAVLNSAVFHAPKTTAGKATQEAIPKLEHLLSQFSPRIERQRIAFILRFGKATHTAPNCGRLTPEFCTS